jgi:hypothetical protein
MCTRANSCVRRGAGGGTRSSSNRGGPCWRAFTLSLHHHLLLLAPFAAVMAANPSALRSKPLSAPASAIAAAAGPSSHREARAFDPATAGGQRQHAPLLAQGAPAATAAIRGARPTSLSAFIAGRQQQQQQQQQAPLRTGTFADPERVYEAQVGRSVEGRGGGRAFRTPPPREPPRTPSPPPRPAGFNPLLRSIPLERLDGGKPALPGSPKPAGGALAHTTDNTAGASTDATRVGSGGLTEDDLRLPLTQDEDDLDDAGGLGDDTGDDTGDDDQWGEDDVTLIFGGLGLADDGPLEEIVVDQEQERYVGQSSLCGHK